MRSSVRTLSLPVAGGIAIVASAARGCGRWRKQRDGVQLRRLWSSVAWGDRAGHPTSGWFVENRWGDGNLYGASAQRNQQVRSDARSSAGEQCQRNGSAQSRAVVSRGDMAK